MRYYAPDRWRVFLGALGSADAGDDDMAQGKSGCMWILIIAGGIILAVLVLSLM
jgi:hypothetical protein